MKIGENWSVWFLQSFMKIQEDEGFFENSSTGNFLVAHSHLQSPCGTRSFINSLWHAVIYKFPVAQGHLQIPCGTWSYLAGENIQKWHGKFPPIGKFWKWIEKPTVPS